MEVTGAISASLWTIWQFDNSKPVFFIDDRDRFWNPQIMFHKELIASLILHPSSKSACIGSWQWSSTLEVVRCSWLGRNRHPQTSFLQFTGSHYTPGHFSRCNSSCSGILYSLRMFCYQVALPESSRIFLKCLTEQIDSGYWRVIWTDLRSW